MIVIKGKMPKGTGCDGCEFQTSTCEQLDACTCYLFEGVICNFHTERHPDCPIKGEIPDEHGRLVEADEITDAIIESERNGEITGGEAGLFTAIVHNAKTIIPSTIH